MALSEQEEFELLSLERERSQGQQPAAATPAPVEMPGDAPDERDEGIRFQEDLRATVEGAARVLGLTARAGLEGVVAPGAVLGDVAGLKSTEAARNLLTKLGLPVPQEGTTEEFANSVASLMAGAGGLMGAAAKAPRALRAAPVPGGRGAPPMPIVEQLAERPGVGIASAAGAGVGGEIAEEAGAGPMGQFAAGIGGALAAPSVAAVGGRVTGALSDVVNALKAAFGSEKAITRITADAVEELVRTNPQAIANALENAPRDIPGVKPTVGEAVAARNLARPEEQVGGALIAMQKRLRGAKGVEDVIPTAEAGQEQAVRQYIRQLGERTDPMREKALAAAQMRGGAKPTAPLMAIYRVLRTPEGKSQIGTRTLNALRNRITKLTNSETGRIDPADLYTIRKEVGNTIAGFVKPGMKWDKKMTARLEREVQKAIDDAIEDAGGTGWKSYLETYAKGMKPVQAREAVLKEKAGIEAIVEPRSVEEIAKAELPKLPTLLHRPTMAVNFALRMIAGDITDPVAKELAKRMTDPEKFLELMRRPTGTPARQAMNVILARAAILANLIQQHQEDSAAQEGE